MAVIIGTHVITIPPSPVQYPGGGGNPIPISITQPNPLPLPLPNPIPNPPRTRPEEPEPRKSCKCRFIRLPFQRGGNSHHNNFAAYLQGGLREEIKVITPDGDSAGYDAATPVFGDPTTVYEAKPRHAFLFGVNFGPMIDERSEQFAEQAKVARKCRLQFTIAVDNLQGTLALRRHWPTYDIQYVPFSP